LYVKSHLVVIYFILLFSNGAKFQIKKLSSQLTIMKMDQDDHDDKQRRLREENKMLLNK